MQPPKRHLFPLIILALLPYGLLNAAYNSSATHMAGMLGLSADEAVWITILYNAGQLSMLPLACWLAWRRGANWLLLFSSLPGAIGSGLILLTTATPLHLLAWALFGIATSGTLFAIQTLILLHLPVRIVVYCEGIVLLLTIILPAAGLYPWIIASLAENSLWQLLYIVPLFAYILAAGWVWIAPVTQKSPQPIGFNLLQATLVTALLCCVTFFLLRGNTYNWFDSPLITQIAQWCGILLLLTAFAMSRRWGRGEYLGTSILLEARHLLSLYNAALAGFAASGAALLLNSYLGNVLRYSQSEAAWIQLPTLGSTLLGLIVTLWVANHSKIRIDLIIPIGVALIMASTVQLFSVNANSGLDDMLPALMLRGLGIGLLNTAVTITILLSFPREHIPQGVCYFYLIRTLGTVASTGLFSRLFSVENSANLQVLGENFNTLNSLFIERQQMIAQILQRGMVEASPERVASLLSQQLQAQVSAITGINSFEWLLFTLCLLGPPLGITKAWLARRMKRQVRVMPTDTE